MIPAYTPPEPIPDHELPDELPARMVGRWELVLHLNYGKAGGAATYRWIDEAGRAWPIQRQYDTRTPKPAGPRGGKAVEPAKTGMVIIDRTAPGGFYGEVTPSYRQLCDTWREWRASKKAPAPPAAAPLQDWPFPASAEQQP